LEVVVGMKMLRERVSKHLLEKSTLEWGRVHNAPMQAFYWNLERKLGAAAATRAGEKVG
jgi:hypothetical protein